MNQSAMTVLLVDDEIDFLQSLAQRLALRGVDVLTASSGLEALEVLNSHQVDVTLLDVRMPGMDGIETLKAIKASHPAVKVIMLTGHADLEASLEGLQLGFFDYLIKPVSIDKLMAKLESAAEEEGGEAPALAGETFGDKMKQRMMAADRLASLGTLAASIAHELNNPLAIISEATGWLMTKVAKDQSISPELRESFDLALEKTQSSVERARRISRGLLSFARHTDSQVIETDLEALLSEAAELTGKTAANRGVEVVIETSGGPSSIQVDPFLLRQVLLNLLTNALDAVGQGGKVRLVVTGGADEAIIEVRDNGAGIAPENIERIFEPFYTTKQGDKGTGLGLPVSRAIVEELGGRMEVQSSPGQGSTFRVILPRKQATQETT